MTKRDMALELARELGVVRPRDFERRGIPHVYLQRLTAQGLLERSARGLYRLAESTVTEFHSLAEVSKRVPHGVVCLLSALRYHNLTTQAPFAVWLAIPTTARRATMDDLWRYGRICRVANIMRPYLESLETLI